MAHQRIKGLTTSKILEMPMSQFEKYTPTQQREIVSKLASTANKRLATFQRKGITNPATLRMKLSGGKASVRGKSGEALKNELFRTKQFLKSEFSTQTGWTRFSRKVREGLEQSPRIEKGMKRDKLTDLAFSYYDVLSDRDPNIANNRDRYKIVGEIADILEDTTDFEEVAERVTKYLESAYAEEQERANQFTTSFTDWLEDIPDRFKRK